MLRIYFNFSWGGVRTDARSFSRSDGTILAGTDEKAQYPLFGFQLPAESYPIAEWHGEQVRLFPPIAAKLHWSQGKETPAPVPSDALQREGDRSYLTLSRGTRVEIRQDDLLLTVLLEEQRDRAPWDKKNAAFWLTFLTLVTLGAPAAFLLAGPDMSLPQRALESARLKQGLPAQPEKIDLEALESPTEPAKDDGQKRLVIPASVR